MLCRVALCVVACCFELRAGACCCVVVCAIVRWLVLVCVRLCAVVRHCSCIDVSGVMLRRAASRVVSCYVVLCCGVLCFALLSAFCFVVYRCGVFALCCIDVVLVFGLWFAVLF